MRYVSVVLGIVLLASLPRSLPGQEPAPERSQSATESTGTVAPACTAYLDCALRVESSIRGGLHIVRGADGSRAAALGPLRAAALVQVFSANDSASFHAQRFIVAERTNRMLTLGGVIFGAVGLASERRMNVLTGAGAGLLLGSIPYQVAAQRALSRAVWWYNESLDSSARR